MVKIKHEILYLSLCKRYKIAAHSETVLQEYQVAKYFQYYLIETVLNEWKFRYFPEELVSPTTALTRSSTVQFSEVVQWQYELWLYWRSLFGEPYNYLFIYCKVLCKKRSVQKQVKHGIYHVLKQIIKWHTVVKENLWFDSSKELFPTSTSSRKAEETSNCESLFTDQRWTRHSITSSEENSVFSDRLNQVWVMTQCKALGFRSVKCYSILSWQIVAFIQ